MTTGAIRITTNRFRRQGDPTKVSVSRFLVIMASVSLASKIVEWLASRALLAWFDLSLDPFSLSLARQAAVTMLGIAVAYCLSRHGQASATKRHLLLTPLVAMGVNLMLVLLSQVAGQTHAFDWPVALVYLLWAWGHAASTV